MKDKTDLSINNLNILDFFLNEETIGNIRYVILERQVRTTIIIVDKTRTLKAMPMCVFYMSNKVGVAKEDVETGKESWKTK